MISILSVSFPLIDGFFASMNYCLNLWDWSNWRGILPLGLLVKCYPKWEISKSCSPVEQLPILIFQGGLRVRRMRSWHSSRKNKVYLLPDIIEIFRNSGKKTIIDVFGGSGKILLNTDARVKIYNDLNADVVDFFEELRNNKDAVL